jgi:AraC family cel operon transcriptional repressor
MFDVLKWRNITNGDFHISERLFKGPLTTYHHMHEFYEFLVVTDGSMSHIHNGQTMFLQKGSLCLIFPDDEHFFRLEPDQSASCNNIALSKEFYHRTVSTHAACTGVDQKIWRGMSKNIPVELFPAIISRINFLLSDKVILSGMKKQDILMGILFDCLTYLQNSNIAEQKAPFWLLEACDSIQKDDSRELRIERLVSLSGRSQEHLTRSMKRHYNITPSVYINRLKLNRAAHLLKTTDQSVLDIIISCGFNNVAYFNRLFKNEFGMTPTRMRSRSVIIV